MVILQRNNLTGENMAINTDLAKVANQCSTVTFVVNQSLVLRINPDSYRDGENRHLRQARNCYASCYADQRQLTNRQKYANI